MRKILVIISSFYDHHKRRYIFITFIIPSAAEIDIFIKYKNSLVFQGEVERLALKNPQEISKLFEEISGSIEYKAAYDKAVIEKRIQYLDKVFDLVLITDYFEESIVLLKEELCWTTEEVAFLKANSRKRESQSGSQNLLDSKYKEKLLEWNKADWKLYQHFNTTFAKKASPLSYSNL